MSNEITYVDLDEWDRLANEATSGPWGAQCDGTGGPVEAGWNVYEVLEDDPPIVRCENWQEEANARFIAAARTAMPALTAALRRAWKDTQEVKNALEAALRTPDGFIAAMNSKTAGYFSKMLGLMLELIQTGKAKSYVVQNFLSHKGDSWDLILQRSGEDALRPESGVVPWAKKRIQAILHAPRMYGSDEVVEMEVLMLLDLYAFASDPGNEDERRMLNAYVKYVMKQHKTNGPLSQVIESDHLGKNMADALRKALQEIAPELLEEP